MGFLLFLASTLLLSLGLLRQVPSEEGEGFERPGLAFLLWFAVLIGTNWLLAAFGGLRPGALWGCSALYSAVGLWLLLRAGGRFRAFTLADRNPLLIAALVALAAVGLYVFVRGTLIYPDEYDALTYHLPKAVEIVRAHGLPRIPSNDFRLAYFPWNYEFLVADALMLTPGDALVHGLGMMACLGFLAAAYGAFRKAWPGATAREGFWAFLVLAATPVLILHYGDYKNDALFSFFLLAFLYWSCAWGEAGGTRRLVLACLALGLAFGTKASSLFLAPGILVFLWRYRARFSGPWKPARVLLALAGLVVLAYLSGSAWPLFNKVWCGHFLGDSARVGGMGGYESNSVPRYTGFANLWKFPVLVFLKPFSSKPDAIWVFWKHRYEWWTAYHPIYSHFGWLCSILLLAIPHGVLLHRRERGAAFRLAFTLYGLLFILFAMPQRYRVDGMYCGFPRYLLGIPVLVILWSLLPILLRLRNRRLLQGLALGLLGYFCAESWVFLKNDITKSFAIVAYMIEHPGRHLVETVSNQVDKVAGPRDGIAFDSGFGGMAYPLYGSELSRPVTYIPRGAGVAGVPAGARWVVIDRNWNVGWSHPGVTTTADFWLPVRPAPTAEDQALFNQVSADPRFAMVYCGQGTGEAVFVRRDLAPAPSRESHGE